MKGLSRVPRGSKGTEPASNVQGLEFREDLVLLGGPVATRDGAP